MSYSLPTVGEQQIITYKNPNAIGNIFTLPFKAESSGDHST